MAEHTPFPWEGHGYIVFSPHNGVVCEMSEPHPVRMVTHYDQDRTPHEVEFHPLEHNEVALGSKSRDEVKANMALILAIPEMLVLLEELRGEFLDRAHSSGDPADPANMEGDAIYYREICALLAKVEEE